VAKVESAKARRKRICVQIAARAGETAAVAAAREITRPVVLAATTLVEIDNNLEVNSLIAQLSSQVETASSGNSGRSEEMLLSQAHTVDGLFNALARRAVANINTGHREAGDQYLRLAMKAQAQCRCTIETLAEIKNPRPVAFVRQANIANGPQQVNNGTRAEISEMPPNKLLGVDDGQRLDAGAATSSIRSNPPLETVGAINRTADGHR
jgi:hypothetical protein